MKDFTKVRIKTDLVWFEMIFLSRHKPFDISPRQGPSRRLQKHKIGVQVRDAVTYFIRDI